MNSELKFPIYGCFTSKRGTFWHYCIYRDLIVEQWHSTTKRVTGGWKQGNDVYSPKCTKELKQYIKEKYGIEVRDG